MLLLLPIALFSGFLTVLSPCVLPILPIVLASGIDGNTKRIRGLIVGLVVVFTVLTLSLAAIVTALNIPADTLRFLAVIFLILFGIALLFPSIWGKIQAFIETRWHIRPAQGNKGSFWGGFVTGSSLAVVWTPCVGPIIATVATLAALNSFSTASVLLVSSYAIGIGIGLYIIARGGQAVSEKLGFIKRNNQTIRRVFGGIIIITALLIAFGFERQFQAWAIRVLPEKWAAIATTFESSFNVDEKLKGMGGESEVEKAAPGSTKVNKNIKLQSDYTGAKVEKGDLLQGCFGKDCIPSIDDPKFDDGSWLTDSDIVFAVDYNGVVRAYPQRILNWHELVNDTLNDKSVVITFCPLCGSALGFERVVDGVITEFGVSGKLHDNDLVMYDRYEGNLWQQITGEGIVGPAARRSEILKQIPIITVSWGEWKAEHPNSEVLSRDTGFSRNYDQYPYGTYEENDTLLFGVKNLDKSLQIKTVVYGLEVGESAKAYPESALKKYDTITDSIGGVRVRVERKADGKITAENLDTGEEIIPIRLFWFAWAAFHPNTELYESE